MADKVFVANTGLAMVLEDSNCHSDIEDGPDGTAPVGIVAPWRSVQLSSILHNLDHMVQAQTTHPKTIETNKSMYKRSKRNHTKVVGGAVGVPRDWPIDCYDETFWKGLSKFEQETISKSPRVGIQEISNKLAAHCGKGHQGGPPDRNSASKGKGQCQPLGAEGSPVIDESRMIDAPGPSGSMNVD